MKSCAFVVIAIVAGAITLTAANELASPESVGFSADGLKAFQQSMRALVDEGKLANVEIATIPMVKDPWKEFNPPK